MLNSSYLTASHQFSSRPRSAKRAEARGSDREEKAGAVSGSPALNPRHILLAILLFAAFLRFFELPTVPRGIQVDEAMNGANILEIHETGRYQIFYPENNGREGLFINLQALA